MCCQAVKYKMCKYEVFIFRFSTLIDHSKSFYSTSYIHPFRHTVFCHMKHCRQPIFQGSNHWPSGPSLPPGPQPSTCVRVCAHVLPSKRNISSLFSNRHMFCRSNLFSHAAFLRSTFVRHPFCLPDKRLCSQLMSQLSDHSVRFICHHLASKVNLHPVWIPHTSVPGYYLSNSLRPSLSNSAHCNSVSSGQYTCSPACSWHVVVFCLLKGKTFLFESLPGIM